jgi:hypothetical protein
MLRREVSIGRGRAFFVDLWLAVGFACIALAGLAKATEPVRHDGGACTQRALLDYPYFYTDSTWWNGKPQQFSDLIVNGNVTLGGSSADTFTANGTVSAP